jgi:protein AATF/BFR2
MFGSEEPNTEETTIVPEMKTNENYQKSVSVKNQLEIWEKLLEVRIKSQKLLLTANSLPLPQSFEKLSDSSEFDRAVEQTFANIETLLTNLQEFQHVGSRLVDQFHFFAM